MSSIQSTLSIARQGLMTSQLGLHITGHNVANVNTVGYKRQRVNQVNMPYGMGVRVESIERNIEPLVQKRLLDVTSSNALQTDRAECYQQLEELMNETKNRGLDAELSDFFESLQDLSSAPGGQAERTTLRGRGESLASVFEYYHDQMAQQIADQDKAIDTDVATANDLINRIAAKNQAIAMTRNDEIALNDLYNDRDELVRQLAEILPVTQGEDERGTYMLFVEAGMPLVAGVQAYQLESRPDATDDNKRDVYWVSDTGATQDVTSQMTKGSLGAAIEARDKLIPDELEKIDRLAAEFVLAFNEQHRAGTGLDGVSGRNFFSTLPVFTHVGENSQGGVGVMSATVADETQLTLDDYEIRFTSPTTYEVVNTTAGTTVTSGAYTPGATLTFAGMSITLDNASGPPVAGDYFRVNMYENASENIELTADLQNSTDVIAAGFTGQTGDNQNALRLIALQSQALAGNSTVSFQQYYKTIITNLGTEAAAANNQYDSQEALLNQVTTLTESVSGVNLDEESTTLMVYQRAYQAASKVIQIADEMMATMIDMIR
jgi:flagellar hook-associated protein 1 FlgK